MSKASLSGVAQHFGISRTAARDLEIQNVINRGAGSIAAGSLIFDIFVNDIRDQMPPTLICARPERARSRFAPLNGSAG